MRCKKGLKMVFRENAKTPAVPLLPLSTHVCTYATPPTHAQSGPVLCLCLKQHIFAHQLLLTDVVLTISRVLKQQKWEIQSKGKKAFTNL